MVKGQTYSEQAFESSSFRHFINTFLAGESGITKGCEIVQGTTAIDIRPGYFIVMGGLLKEEGTSNTIPGEAGYYRLVYEVDLSQTNTDTEFNQGNYKFLKGIGLYPSLTQEDLENSGNIYQFEFCQFRVTESGIQDFTDMRSFLDFDSIYEEVREKISEIENGSMITEAINELRSELKSEINSLASGSPLVASSVDEMTDTKRVYVNTTDGNWYYYNGTEWVQGGIYQSTSDTENLINLYPKYTTNDIVNSFFKELYLTGINNSYKLNKIGRNITVNGEQRWIISFLDGNNTEHNIQFFNNSPENIGIINENLTNGGHIYAIANWNVIKEIDVQIFTDVGLLEKCFIEEASPLIHEYLTSLKNRCNVYTDNEICNNFFQKLYLTGIDNTWKINKIQRCFLQSDYYRWRIEFISKDATIGRCIVEYKTTSEENIEELKWIDMDILTNDGTSILGHIKALVDWESITLGSDNQFSAILRDVCFHNSSNFISEKVMNFDEFTTKYRYIAPTFDTNKMSLNLIGSNDLINWYPIAENIYTPNIGRKTLRDPSWCKINGYYYLTYTVIDWDYGLKIGMARTKDFVHFYELPQLDIDFAGLENANRVYAPAFCPIDGKIYIVMAIINHPEDDSGDTVKTVIYEYNAKEHKITLIGDTGTGYIDSHIYKINNKYYMFSTHWTMFVSDSLTGPYNMIFSDSNFIPTSEKFCEGPYLMKLDNGKYRYLIQSLSEDKYLYVDTKSENIEDGFGEIKECTYHNIKDVPAHITIMDCMHNSVNGITSYSFNE